MSTGERSERSCKRAQLQATQAAQAAYIATKTALTRSSVGSCAVQIAHILGARVVGIAGGPKKCAWVKSLGAAEGVDYKAADFEEQLKAALPDGADRYLDMVGGKVFDSMLPNMAMHGVIGIIGGVSGYNGDYAAYRNMLMFPVKRLTLKGESSGASGASWASASHEPERVILALAFTIHLLTRRLHRLRLL